MKNKLFLLAVIMAFIGCSDDDDKGTPNDALTEYPVNFSYSASFLGSDLFNESNPYLYSSTNDKYSMGLGELRVYDNMGKEYLVYDNACPYEWDKNTEYSSLKAFNTDTESYEVKCLDCLSVFNLRNGSAVSGPAKDKKLKLVSYKMELVNNFYVFSNPRYKE